MPELLVSRSGSCAMAARFAKNRAACRSPFMIDNVGLSVMIYHEPLTLKAFEKRKHILVRHAPHWRPYYRETLDRPGVSLDIALEVPSFGIVDHIVETCDLIFTASAGFERIILATADNDPSSGCHVQHAPTSPPLTFGSAR